MLIPQINCVLFWGCKLTPPVSHIYNTRFGGNVVCSIDNKTLQILSESHCLVISSKLLQTKIFYDHGLKTRNWCHKLISPIKLHFFFKFRTSNCRYCQWWKQIRLCINSNQKQLRGFIKDTIFLSFYIDEGL